MKKITIATLLLLPCVAAVAQQTVTIKGTVTGDTKGFDKVYFFGKDVRSDSAVIKDGRFSITMPFEKPGFQQMYLEFTSKQRAGMALFGVLIEKPGTISIDDIDLQRGIQSGKISGMSSAVDFDALQGELIKASMAENSPANGMMARGVTAQRSLIARTGDTAAKTVVAGNTTIKAVAADNRGKSVPATRANGGTLTPTVGGPALPGTTVMKPILARRSGEEANTPGKQHRDSVHRAVVTGVFENFIRTHPDSYAAAYALDGTGRWELSTAEVERLYKMLSPVMQQSDAGIHTADYLVGIKTSAIGQTVKDFTLNTREGTPFSFASLKGKYVLIDFWASWCGPCKASFPHMKEVYSKFKRDKFEIYSISIDKDKAAWLKESTVQALPWLQTLDTKNISQSTFAVTAIPTTFLIDPQGKIIMKSTGFDTDGNSDLEKKLVELFGK